MLYSGDKQHEQLLIPKETPEGLFFCLEEFEGSEMSLVINIDNIILIAMYRSNVVFAHISMCVSSPGSVTRSEVLLNGLMVCLASVQAMQSDLDV